METINSSSTNLVILNNEGSKMEEVTTLTVYTPVIGRCAPNWSPSNAPSHLWSLDTSRLLKVTKGYVSK